MATKTHPACKAQSYALPSASGLMPVDESTALSLSPLVGAAPTDSGVEVPLPFPGEWHRAKGWLSYAQLERLLSAIYGADSDKKVSVVRSRYKHFQKLGLPYSRNTGKGVRKLFDVSQVIQLVLAFELSDSGIAPSNVIKVVRTLASKSAANEPALADALIIIEKAFLNLMGAIYYPFDKCFILLDLKFISLRLSDEVEDDFDYLVSHQLSLGEDIAGSNFSSLMVLSVDALADQLRSAAIKCGVFEYPR